MSPRRAILSLGAIRNAPLPGEWVEQAACRGLAPTDGHSEHPFFTSRGQRPRAAVVCEGCPVLVECRRYALRYPVLGSWGGMDEDSRVQIRRARWRERQREAS